MRKIRVLLADDHAVLRGGLRLMLNGQPDMEVVGEAGNGLDTVSMTAELKPDVILLDLSMPILDGIGVIEKLQGEANATKILVLTMHDDDGYLQKVLTRGAHGYILKMAADADLLAAIRSVDSGNVYI
jgi:two-component system response regulator NreC